MSPQIRKIVSLLLRHGPIEDARPAPSTSSGRGLRQSQDRLATNGDDPRIASNAWVLQAVWFDTPRRGTAGRLTTNGVGPAGAGARRTTWVSWVLGAVWFDTPRRKTLGRLTTNGGRPGGELNRGLSRRLGCCWLCGSTRSSGDSRPAHHERLLPLDWVRMSGLVDCGLRFGGLVVGGAASRG